MSVRLRWKRKRKPTALDRDVVDYLSGLKAGFEHRLYIVAPFQCPIKVEGGMVVRLDDGRQLCIVPGAI